MAAVSTPASAGFADIDGSHDPDFYIKYLLEADRDAEVQEMKRASLELLRLRPGLDALEVGCGLGSEVAAIKTAVAPGRALGLDGSQRVIDYAKSVHPELELAVGDAQALTLPDRSFDRYRAERLYQHLDDPQQALAEAIRVLRPGGLLLIGDPDWETLTLGSDDEELEEILRYRVSSSVKHPRVPLQVGPWLYGLGGEIVTTQPTRMRFRQAATIERIAGSAIDAFAPGEHERILNVARQLEADGSLYGALTLIWVVGRKL